MTPSFWKTKALADFSAAEWESLCDRCGLCCLEKYEDRKSGQIYLTSLPCQFLEIGECRCLIYENRHCLYPDCINLSPANLYQLNWLPESCAYRLVADGGQLPPWHHLVCGDAEAVHQAGISIINKAVCGRYADPSDGLTAIIGLVKKRG